MVRSISRSFWRGVAPLSTRLPLHGALFGPDRELALGGAGLSGAGVDLGAELVDLATQRVDLAGVGA